MHRVRTTSQTLRCEAYRMQSQPTSTHPCPDPSSECLVGACSYNRRHAGLPTPTPKESDPRHSHVAELTKPSPTSIRTACLPPPHLHSPVCPIKSRPALAGTDTASLPPKEAIRHRALPEAQGGDRRNQVLDTEKTSASKGQCVCAEPQTSMAACSRPREGLHLGDGQRIKDCLTTIAGPVVVAAREGTNARSRRPAGFHDTAPRPSERWTRSCRWITTSKPEERGLRVAVVVAVVVAFPDLPNRRADVELDRVATG
ncbi:hypothetical protein BN1723_009331 [Verticillium longisporum]|uniref:Uncharacterized protein n=1 Tax=Verticillium longisporum TaxID=100787 RepID=A0A0G4KN95_VERLO|nr:hypothetical protein BN1723_009331 [Verticillium longisporum]